MIRWLTEALINKPHWRGSGRLVNSFLRMQIGKPVRSKYGPVLLSDIRDRTNYYCISGRYTADYDDIAAEVRRLEPGMAFLDIGANIGLFSMMASPIVGSAGVVVAFEPSSRLFTQLVTNSGLNGLDNFYPFNAALGPETGVAYFSPGPASHTGTGHLDEKGDVAVVQMRLDDFEPLFLGLIGKRRTIAKIDVEGAEELVVRSMAGLFDKLAIERLLVEVDPELLAQFGSTAESLYARLADLGYRPLRGLGTAKHYNEIFERSAAPAA